MGSDERVDILNEEGIDVSVLYPTLGLQWVSEPDYHMALNRALNDWLGDFVKADARRLYGAANIVAIWDVEMACDEIRRCVTEHGFPAAFLRSALPDGESRWWRDTYDPFWATCQDLDIAIGFHPFPGDIMYGSGRYFDYVGPTGAQMFIRTPFNHMVDSMNTLTALIVGGTFERFPNLRVGILESSGGWLLTLLERLDNRFDHLGQIVPEMQMAPSDYFRRNCWISFDPEEAPSRSPPTSSAPTALSGAPTTPIRRLLPQLRRDAEREPRRPLHGGPRPHPRAQRTRLLQAARRAVAARPRGVRIAGAADDGRPCVHSLTPHRVQT